MMTGGPVSNNQMVHTLQPMQICPQFTRLGESIIHPLKPADVIMVPAPGMKRAAHEAGLTSSRKSVRFEEHRNNVIPRPQTEETSSFFSSWYDAIDYRNFQLDARNTMIAYFQSGNNPFLLDPSQHCLRGLEKHQFPPQVRALYKAQNRQYIRLISSEYSRLREARVADVERQVHEMCALYTVPAKTYARHLTFLGAE